MPLGKTHSKCILSCQYHTYIIKPKKNVIENELNWQCSKNQLHRNYQQIEAIHNLVVRRLPSSRSSASIVIACAGHILWNEANLWEIWAEQGLKSKDNSKLSWTFVLNLEMLRQNPLSLAWRCWCLDQIDPFWVGNRNKLKIIIIIKKEQKGECQCIFKLVYALLKGEKYQGSMIKITTGVGFHFLRGRMNI